AGDGRSPELYDALLRALDEPVAESRKLAARGLAKLGDVRAEARLLAALEGASGPERKSVVDALGALGGEESARRLARLDSEDADLARRRERARAQIERRLARAADPGQLALDTPLGAPWAVALYCRPGLASVLAEEVRV